ncbi:von Willebrand factor type A domain-containing protein [bacterium]|nr:von Willebrand factor type A domain-containing protein [bacterium]
MKHVRYSIFVLLLLVLLVPQLHAQSGKIVGSVVEKGTGDPIIGANVIIEGTGRGASTDLDGRFVILAVPVGTYTISASAVGYTRQTITDVVLSESRTTLLEFELVSSAFQLEEVTTVYSMPSVELDVSSRAMATRIPGIGSGRFHLPYRRSGEFGGRADAGNEEYGHFVENPYLSTLVSPLSTFAIDVDRASYSIMRSYLDQHQLPPFDAVRLEEFVNYFEYNYPVPEWNDRIAMDAVLSDCPWNGDHQLLRVGLRTPDLQEEDLPPSNFVFLIDVSGSMNSPDKLPLLVSGMNLLVDAIREEDRIAIVTYAGRSGTVLSSTPGSEKANIREALDRLRAGGSTAGASGIIKAYQVAGENFIEDGNNRVILATDGDFNVGISDMGGLEKLITEKRESNIFLTVLGFGQGNLKDNRMELLADKGNGNYSYIDNLNEAKKSLVKELGGLYTVAKDVKLQIEFNPFYVSEYRLLGYENRLLEDEEFDDDTKDGGEMGAGHSVTAFYEIIPAKSGASEVTGTTGLKYQQTKLNSAAERSGELANLAFRYKEPEGSTSLRRDIQIAAKHLPLKKTSDDFRFATSVAEFALLLRESEYAGEATFEQVLELGKKSKGADDNGYRAEFLQLVERAQIIADQMEKEKEMEERQEWHDR